ncbi:unnamed protein product [Prorocentrum cordatum]|uniref:Uncharacterized protein n=1 Tax=Prorocentrum cordatum TaxID=2364126 RepID=A0ABN9WKB9_9DINO|nr:unnamed protein product [Polarella glacialis]
MAPPTRRQAAAWRRGAALCSLAAVALLRRGLPSAAYTAGRAPAPEVQRRGALSAAAVAAAAWPLGEHGAALAESPPQSLDDISGFEGKRTDVNGRWSCISAPYGGSKDLNQRAVYKKDSQELYLMVNDCGQFQINSKVTGECTGFARQEGKGKWLIDGATVDGKVKVKPAVTLKKGDKVEVLKDFKSDDEGEIKLSKGLAGVVTEGNRRRGRRRYRVRQGRGGLHFQGELGQAEEALRGAPWEARRPQSAPPRPRRPSRALRPSCAGGPPLGRWGRRRARSAAGRAASRWRPLSLACWYVPRGCAPASNIFQYTRSAPPSGQTEGADWERGVATSAACSWFRPGQFL